MLVEVGRIMLNCGRHRLRRRFPELADVDARKLADWFGWVIVRLGGRRGALELAKHLKPGMHAPALATIGMTD